MNGSWAIRLSLADACCLGRLRQVPGLRVCQQQDELWLRGDAIDDRLDLLLRGLPGARRYGVLRDGQLVPDAVRVPQGYVPEGHWAPLAEWLGFQLARPALPGCLARRAVLELAPSSAVEEPGVLLTTMVHWLPYASQAPQVRLDRWTFALATDGRVVIRGTPLPPLPGQRWVEHDGVAVPAGWVWSLPIDPEVLAQRFGLSPGDVALVRPEGGWERITAADFVRATRSAVRVSADSLVVREE